LSGWLGISAALRPESAAIGEPIAPARPRAKCGAHHDQTTRTVAQIPSYDCVYIG
jgi:hypothetical protein